MSLVKLLGFLDLVSGVVIVFSSDFKPLLVFVAVFLVVKGLFFGLSFNFVSYLDVLSGFYALVLWLGVESVFLTFLVGLFLLQKGVISVFS